MNGIWTDNPAGPSEDIIPQRPGVNLGSAAQPFGKIYASQAPITVQSGLTATGTVISDAYDITGDLAVFSTVASGTGAQLSSDLEIGSVVEVKNLGANALLIYPDSGSSKINALADGAGYSLAAGAAVRIRKVSDTLFVTV